MERDTAHSAVKSMWTRSNQCSTTVVKKVVLYTITVAPELAGAGFFSRYLNAS